MRATVNQLRSLVAQLEQIDPSGRLIEFEVRDGYDGSMKEHDRCVRATIAGTQTITDNPTVYATARRFGGRS